MGVVIPLAMLLIGLVGTLLVGRYIRRHRPEVGDSFGIFFLFAAFILMAIYGFFGLLSLIPLPS